MDPLANLRPSKPLTATQQRVADAIRRDLTYAEVGKELAAWEGRSKPVSPRTVRAHVCDIARLFRAPPGMKPRVVVYLWICHNLEPRSTVAPAAWADHITAKKREYWGAR